jgi:hypothetical protein
VYANKGLAAIWGASVANKGLSSTIDIALHPGVAQCNLAAGRGTDVRMDVYAEYSRQVSF